MNHRLRFRWEPDIGGLRLIDVWCPGDHGGDCDCREVDTEGHDDDCISVLEPDDDFVDCDCNGAPTGRCWAKENLGLFVEDGPGWLDVLVSPIDLPWCAVRIDGPGPDGIDPITVRVIAEVALKATPASDRGEQSVHQCVACGLLVCVPSPHGARPRLAGCPVCEGARWSVQQVPVGCFARAES